MTTETFSVIGYSHEDFERARRALEDYTLVRWVVDHPVIIAKYEEEHPPVKKRNKVKLSVVAKNTGIMLDDLRAITKMLTKNQPARFGTADYENLARSGSRPSFYISTRACDGIRYQSERWHCCAMPNEGDDGYVLKITQDTDERVYHFASLKTLLEFLDLMVPNEE